ncbi:hypothetical protein PR202_gb07730 [Eleusine coracana subsp. coracana]|uniref:Transposase n=1 Tax=Eleusine coracana subsp. coracana TaxID=191504 RepID=A0AAV5ECI5_ELECO|nr:hypothetical protein PR202_gb07730 [Eleusine coracana subsp. coracana]
MEATGSPNLLDFFPALAAADLQGRGRLVDKLFARLYRVFDMEVEKRLRGRSFGQPEKIDFLDLLLNARKVKMARWCWTVTHYGQCSR